MRVEATVSASDKLSLKPDLVRDLLEEETMTPSILTAKSWGEAGTFCHHLLAPGAQTGPLPASFKDRQEGARRMTKPGEDGRESLFRRETSAEQLVVPQLCDSVEKCRDLRSLTFVCELCALYI